ncbi:MAG TPA: hypothetical protein VIO38_16575, partial [Rariglobus sp.]
MRLSRPHFRPAAPWLRVLAVVCAGMILLLSTAAFSPVLHAWLHGETSESAEHVCNHAHDDAGESDTDHAREHAH